MRQKKPAGEVARRLEQALHRAGRDAQKASILTAALCGFSQPVPEYELLRQHLLGPAGRSGAENSASDLALRRRFFGDF